MLSRDLTIWIMGRTWDEAIATFYPLTLEHLLDLEDLWSGSSKSSKTTSTNTLDNSSLCQHVG